VVLAFFFGYSRTIRPVLRAGLPFRRAARVAVASDTVSIATMELVDNAFILLVPGALAAGLATGLFWWSLGVSLVIAFIVTVPVKPMADRSRARSRGHAPLPLSQSPSPRGGQMEDRRLSLDRRLHGQLRPRLLPPLEDTFKR
jgi:hypothetical protein